MVMMRTCCSLGKPTGKQLPRVPDMQKTHHSSCHGASRCPLACRVQHVVIVRNLAAIKLANEYLQQVLATNWVGRCYLSAAPAALRNMAGRSYCPQLGADARFQGRLASTDASSVGVA